MMHDGLDDERVRGVRFGRMRKGGGRVRAHHGRVVARKRRIELFLAELGRGFFFRVTIELCLGHKIRAFFVGFNVSLLILSSASG